MTRSNLEKFKLEMVCSPGPSGLSGFWHTDYLTGEDFYIMVPEENCTFTCESRLYELIKRKNHVSSVSQFSPGKH